MSLPTERTEHHFVLKEDGRIHHVTMPEKASLLDCQNVHFGKPNSNVGFRLQKLAYQQALQSAISNAVEVSNQEEVINQIGEKHALFSSMRNGWSIEKGKVYSLQCIVEIQSMPSIKVLGQGYHVNKMKGGKVALVTFSQPEREETQEELVSLKWLRDERNILSNTASLMLPSDETEKTKRVAKALQITIEYIELSRKTP